MSSPLPSPILVTGSHRSGTTWVGRMLCASRETTYVHEPFNIGLDAGWLRPPPDNWYQYVCPENEHEWYERVRAVVELRYPAARRPLRPVTVGRSRRVARELLRGAAGRALHRRPLIKDPLALMSTEWLARRFGMRPVVMIRHPAGFVSSLLRMDWIFDFDNWTRQPLLLDDLLAPYADEIRRAAASPPSPLDHAVLLWNALYHVVGGLADRNPDWAFVRHEDLARDPVAEFAQLYEHFGLTYGPRARRVVESYARGAVDDVAPGDIGTIRRDSGATAGIWRDRLDPEQIARVRDGCEALASRFYATASWAST